MTTEEQEEDARRWSKTLQDAIVPMMAETAEVPGVVAFRVFAVVRSKDGSEHAVNAGGRPDPDEVGGVDYGKTVLSFILPLLLDLGDNAELERREARKKT